MNSLKTIKHFALSEGLYRGTALASNLVMLSIIATEKGFGTHGVLISAFIQLAISGLLEIPTGRFADKFGWAKSVHIGLWLKVFNTGLYIFAVIAAHNYLTSLAWIIISVEAISDAFSGAFLNGAYQAAYLKWYQDKNEESSKPLPPLFVTSFKYGIKVRILVPALTMLVGIALLSGENNLVHLSTYLALLAFVLAMRFVVILRTNSDLKSVVATSAYDDSSVGRMPLKSIFAEYKSHLLLFGFGTFLVVGSSFYLYGEVYRLLSKSILVTGSLWITGVVIGFIINVAAVFISKYIADYFSDGKNVTRIFRSILVNASIAVLAAYVLAFVDMPYLQTLILSLYCIFSMVVGNLIQRWVASNVSEFVKPQNHATWFSLAEVSGLLLFGVASGFCLFVSNATSGVLLFLGVVILVSVFFGVLGPLMLAASGSSRMRLASFLNLSLLGPTLLLFSIAVLQDSYSFYTKTKSIKKQGYENLLQVLKSSLRDPVIQGSYTEVINRVNDVVNDHHDTCIEIKINNSLLQGCPKTENKIKEELTDAIFFDGSRKNVAADIKLIGTYDDIGNLARNKLIENFLTYSAFGLLLFASIRFSSRRITSEVTKLTSDKIEVNEYAIKEFSHLHSLKVAAVEAQEQIIKSEIRRTVALQVAHDIRSPLTALTVAVSSLPKEFSTANSLIKGAIKRINGIAEDLFENSSSQFEKQGNFLVTQAVSEILEEKKVINEDINFQLDIKGEMALKANRSYFQRAMSNLINNSIEAKIQGQSLLVKISIQNQNITISDNGCGISETDLNLLKSGRLKTSKVNGHGIGFSGSMSLLAKMGFQYQIASERGTGTSIRLFKN